MIKEKNIDNRYVTCTTNFVSLLHIEAHALADVLFPQILRNQDPAFGHVPRRPLENSWIWESRGESRGGDQQRTPVKHIQGYSLTISQFVLFFLTYFPKFILTYFPNCPSSPREFLQHYMLVPTAIKEVPPGEVVFNLEKFGCIFDYDTLQLKECMTTSPGAVQKILLMWVLCVCLFVWWCNYHQTTGFVLWEIRQQ